MADVESINSPEFVSKTYWRPAEIAPVVFLANANMAAIALEMITFLKAVFQVNRKS